MNILLQSMIIILSLIAGLQAMENEVNDTCYPPDIMCPILTEVVQDNYIDLDFTNFLKRVLSLKKICKQWNDIISEDFVHEAMVLGCERTCPEFLHGKIIYRPIEGSNEGMIELLISQLWNPLGGTFDISQCGDTGEYLSISTGYRKKRKAENEKKIEIGVALRDLVEKELSTTAKDFQGMFYDSTGLECWTDWAPWTDKAPVGIIWTLGGCEGNIVGMDYLTHQNLVEICKHDLYSKWIEATACNDGIHIRANYGMDRTAVACKKFHVYFMTVLALNKRSRN